MSIHIIVLPRLDGAAPTPSRLTPDGPRAARHHRISNPRQIKSYFPRTCTAASSFWICHKTDSASLRSNRHAYTHVYTHVYTQVYKQACRGLGIGAIECGIECLHRIFHRSFHRIFHSIECSIECPFECPVGLGARADRQQDSRHPRNQGLQREPPRHRHPVPQGRRRRRRQRAQESPSPHRRRHVYIGIAGGMSGYE